MSEEKIKEARANYVQNWRNRDNSVSMSLMLVAATMIPVVALLVIPKWIPEAMAKKEELVEQETIEPIAPIVH